MRTLERVVTGIALLIMPLLGLAAAAHQIEQDSPASAVVYGAVSIVVIWQLARLSWRWHKESRLHRHF